MVGYRVAHTSWTPNVQCNVFVVCCVTWMLVEVSWRGNVHRGGEGWGGGGRNAFLWVRVQCMSYCSRLQLLPLWRPFPFKHWDIPCTPSFPDLRG